jgi:DedD protein
MIRDFSKDELEPAKSEHDTELTLGGGTLMALCAGLLLLCIVCFGLGYLVGHRGSSESAAAAMPPPKSKGSVTPSGSGSKPGAAGQVPRLQTQAAVGSSSNSANPLGNLTPTKQPVSTVASESAGSSPAPIKPALGAQVHPALAGQTGGMQPGSAFHVQPAMTQVQGWMVQIAAVSHSEDAEVLVNALRKRGYTVTARRDVGDSLIHVQTGPFVNRNDANAMRQKLLNDGYNAIVQ